jgi:hypothetical protein
MRGEGPERGMRAGDGSDEREAMQEEKGLGPRDALTQQREEASSKRGKAGRAAVPLA